MVNNIKKINTVQLILFFLFFLSSLNFKKYVFFCLVPQEASRDKLHDRKVNEIGRQRAKSGVYTNLKDGCRSFRVKGINDKY